MSQPSDRPWYASGLAFECTQCGQCCSGPGTGYVWVQPEEIRAMAASLEMEEDIDGFERRFVRRVGARQSLVEYPDGDCIFLHPEDRTCLIYEARPSQCRTWPFWNENVASPEAWEAAAERCPGCNRGQIVELHEIQRRCQGGP